MPKYHHILNKLASNYMPPKDSFKIQIDIKIESL